MKKCNICKKELPLECFATNNSKKDKLQTYCKECNKSKQKEYYTKNKEYYKNKAKVRTEKCVEEFKEYKKNLKCSQCGESNPACLDFHHLDPSVKEKEVSLLIRNGNFDFLHREINKCIVLCSNCHRKLHSRLE